MLEREPFQSEWRRLCWFFRRNHNHQATAHLYRQGMLQRRLAVLFLGLSLLFATLVVIDPAHHLDGPVRVFLGLAAFVAAGLGTGALVFLFTLWQAQRTSSSYEDAYHAACDRFVERLYSSSK